MHNLSIHINSGRCRGCGSCCEEFSVWYDDRNGEVVNSEMDRILLLQGLEGKVIKQREKGGTWLIYQIPCSQLLPDKTCGIYNDDKKRPLLCRMFPFDKEDARCPRAIR